MTQKSILRDCGLNNFCSKGVKRRLINEAKILLRICSKTICFWQRDLLKGPKRSFVAVVLLVLVVVGMETWVKNGTNGTKNVSKETKNVREQKSFLIEQKIFAIKIVSNWTYSRDFKVKQNHWFMFSWPFVAM